MTNRTNRTSAIASSLALALLFGAWSGVAGAAPDASDKDVTLFYSKWTKACVDDQGSTVCLTAKEGRIESGLRVVSTVVMDTRGKPPVLRVLLPLGMQLVHGTRIILDSDAPKLSAYSICSENGCVSEYAVDADFINRMKTAKNLIIQAINSNGKPLTLPIPMTDFSAAYTGRASDSGEIDRSQKAIQGKPPADYAADPRVVRQPTRETQDLTPAVYAPWTKFCLKGDDAKAKQVCFTGKDARIESGQPVIAAVIIEPEGEPKRILRITLPLNVKLDVGSRLIVDGGAPLQSPYVICFQNGCMSDFEATPELIASLKKGQNLVVQAISSGGQRMNPALPLAEFARAYDGPPTDPKVFEENQKKLQEELQKRAAKVASRPANDVPIAAAPPIQASQPAMQSGQPQGRRVALVIGNSAYKFMPVLRSPGNDAVDVESTLKSLGFETVLATDLDRTAMNTAVSRFSRLVPEADVAVVYYSGHGMQFSGKNYLLPIDANLESAADVNRFQLMPVDDLIDVLGAAKGLQLIVLDACRNNPVERDFKNRMASASPGNKDAGSTKGFSRIDARNGLVIAYATAPNDVAADGSGRNSPFTQAFLKGIVTPDVELRQMLFRVQSEVYASSGSRQLPEISSLYVGPDIRLKSSAR
jgi:invasion protein IalB